MLWAIAQDLVLRNGLWRKIWLCIMGYSSKPITSAHNCITLSHNLVSSFKKTVMLRRICTYVNSTDQGLYQPRFKSLGICKKNMVPHLCLFCMNKFHIQITWQIRNRIIKKKCCFFFATETKWGWLMKKAGGLKSHATVSLKGRRIKISKNPPKSGVLIYLTTHLHKISQHVTLVLHCV
jgi:hypothetical protein